MNETSLYSQQLQFAFSTIIFSYLEKIYFRRLRFHANLFKILSLLLTEMLDSIHHITPKIAYFVSILSFATFETIFTVGSALTSQMNDIILIL